MKKLLGFCSLLILLLAISGCTQPAQQTPVSTPQTTAATEVPTTDITTLPTTVETTIPTTIATTIVPATTTARAENISTTVATKIPTPKVQTTFRNMVTVIHITNNTFTPSELSVLPGTGITWKNDDTVVHSLKPVGSHAGMFNSGEIVPGASWSYTFSQKIDTYQIGDPHIPQMNCTIIVKED